MALQAINSNVSRLTQRITENFKESTRDIPLFQGNAKSSAAYFEYNHDKLKDISWLLEGGGDKPGTGATGISAVTSRMSGDAARLEGMKRLIAMISKGRDMSGFFAQVVKQVASPSIEIRKLRINKYRSPASFDQYFPKRLIGSVAIDTFNVFASFNVDKAARILMMGLKKLAVDRNPWVRKTVALGLPKVYDMDASTQPLLLPILATLLQSPSPITLGASLTAFQAICPDNLSFLHVHYRRICRLLVDADEWGQAIALDILIRYARTMLENPESSASAQSSKVEKSNGREKPSSGKAKDTAEHQDEDADELDPDIELLLHCATPLFQSRNSAVVLGTVRLFYLVAPASHEEVGQAKLVRPLIRLMNGLGSAEVKAVAAEVCRQVAEERPWLLSAVYTSFLLHSTDSIRVKRTKIRILNALLTAENADMLLREFQVGAKSQIQLGYADADISAHLQDYIRFPEVDVSEDAIKAVGHCARKQISTRKLALGILINLLNSSRGHAVVVLKSLVQPDTSPESVSESIKLVAKLVRQLPEITNGSARSCVYWLAGQYAEADRGDSQIEAGDTFQGLQPWAPDTLRIGAKEFTREPSLAKSQILTLAAKLLVICPTARPIHALATYIFNLARYDEDWDVRDRSRFLRGLLRSIFQTPTGDGSDDNGLVDGEEGDAGGVVLRREQIRMVLLAAKETVMNEAGGGKWTELLLAGKPLQGYEALSDWTDDPTDASLRDVEEESPIRPMVTSSHQPFQQISTFQGIATPVLASIGSSPASTGAQKRIPAAHAKSRFKNLDDFLNESESEEESGESEEERVLEQAEVDSEGESSEESEVTSEEESAEEDNTLIAGGR
ncbi:hypothetical protein QFC22_005329 [Naganishia vaughanmartiniae]|uniref:Uncharacterized protein n=1 Tax=Naganishia vaughanmartiniae TaxID=1424756 RepID=A0ACC2WVZ5_9TREE|nr:hypothetical protein QFC22_005329 [Naganishia vaughanmartiniae]